MPRFATTASVLLGIALAGPALAGEAADRANILAGYARQAAADDPAFSGFSAARGEELFRTRRAGGDARTPACTACHTEDPRSQGRNAKTGRPIEAVAVSVDPERFTDIDEVEEQFRRDCDAVLGRACTPLEKGDYITFMQEQ